MKFVKLCCVLLLCLSLCGCNLLSASSYISIVDHQHSSKPGANQSFSAGDYEELYEALLEMIESGVTQRTISVDAYEKETLASDLKHVADDICTTHPIAAYAVENITCTVGSSGGTDALSVEISYIHDKTQIRKIVKVADNKAAHNVIATALNNCETGIVLQILNYEDVDFEQIIEDYALQYPEFVMETPQVTVSLYPDAGKNRVVELKFTYQTSREILKNMQSQVSPVFASAVLYVSGDGEDQEKFSQLYSFLMERYDYVMETSITPTYSLLRHGVGDVRAFAVVYAAMCRQAGLECLVVSGTRNGESWYWNIVLDNGVYYHVDLLRCSQEGNFQEMGDRQMEGYVWAADFYPACGLDEPEPDPDPDANPEEDEEIIEK